MQVETISKENKYNLSKLRESIDLIELSLEIERLTEELDYVYQKKVRGIAMYNVNNLIYISRRFNFEERQDNSIEFISKSTGV